MNVKEYASIFKEALVETGGFVDAAICITEQIGLDNRTKFINDNQKPKADIDEKPTEKQINFLTKRKVAVPLTKKEATQLIDKLINP